MRDPTQAAAAVNKGRPPGHPGDLAKARLRAIGGLLLLIVRRFRVDRCPQAAAALTYTTLLSLVPLVTITLGILSAFPAFQDVRSSVQGLVFDNLVPQVGSAVMDYVEEFSARATSLTGAGVIGLIVTSILLLVTIEGAFNAIWRVTNERPLIIRLLSFWALLTVTPLLFAVSLTLTDRVMGGTFESSSPPWPQLAALMPGLSEWFGFTIIFRIIPNRAVRLRDAAVGGLVAAVLFEICKTGFAFYLQYFPIYETVYGAISTVPIFLIWLYVAWLVVLLGAVTAATLPDWRSDSGRPAPEDNLGAGDRLLLAVWVLRHLWQRSRKGESVTRDAMLSHLPVALTTLEAVLRLLADARLITQAIDESWVALRDPADVPLGELAKLSGVWTSERLADPVRIVGAEAAGDGLARSVAAVIEGMDARQSDLMSLPLSDLIAGNAAAAPSGESAADHPGEGTAAARAATSAGETQSPIAPPIPAT
ncbi:MAG: YihY family inner membrane protein [Rhodospirillaceae bacterium]|nr:YihY family inner membrane protein [Rhodospirillaceae bacterium]